VRRGMGSKPVGQVFYLPAPSDSYVSALRWAQLRCWGPCISRVVARGCCCFGLWALHLTNGGKGVPFLHSSRAYASSTGASLPPRLLGVSVLCQALTFILLSLHLVSLVPRRNWMANEAGGGPFGPMDASWLQRAGPRLSDEQLLDHYHSHTKHCSICRPALRNMRLARTAAAVVGIASAAVAAMALMLQFAGQLATGSALLPAVQSAVQQGAGLISLACSAAAVAAVSLLVWSWCAKQIPRFFTGRRPHARNRVSGEYSP
jgi:hypothetical protein